MLSCGRIKYPGLAQLVARVVWEHRPIHSRQEYPKPGNPCDTSICRIFISCETGPKNRFDHINDHRHKKLSIARFPCYNRDKQISGCSPVGRAPHLGCGSRAFESRHSDHRSVLIGSEYPVTDTPHFLFVQKQVTPCLSNSSRSRMQSSLTLCWVSKSI